MALETAIAGGVIKYGQKLLDRPSSKERHIERLQTNKLRAAIEEYASYGYAPTKSHIEEVTYRHGLGEWLDLMPELGGYKTAPTPTQATGKTIAGVMQAELGGLTGAVPTGTMILIGIAILGLFIAVRA